MDNVEPQNSSGRRESNEIRTSGDQSWSHVRRESRYHNGIRRACGQEDWLRCVRLRCIGHGPQDGGGIHNCRVMLPREVLQSISFFVRNFYMVYNERNY
jgi:hypothetical protein